MRQVGGVVAMLSCCMGLVSRRVLTLLTAATACAGLAACGGGTDPATQVTPTSAVLRAHGHTDASPGHYSFQYAPDASALGTWAQYATPVRGPIPAHVPASGDVAFGEAVGALQPSTSYSYRVCGGDAQVKPDACTPAKSFTTPAGTPVIGLTHTTPVGVFNGYARGVAVTDVDRDGVADLVAVAGVQPSGPPGPPGPVLVARGDGHGGFGAPASVAVPGVSEPAALVARDLDHDGKVDLAVGGHSGVTTLRGDGAGGFAPAGTTALDGGVLRLVAGDLDRDGRADLVAIVTGDGRGPHVVVLHQGATGGFTASADLDAAEAPAQEALGDLDHDGRLDLVLATTAPAGVSVLLGNGTGGFGAVRHVSVPGAHPSDLVLGDVDRDGSLDAIVGGSTANPSPTSLLAGDGHGGLGAPVVIPNAPDADLVLADFNGDGRLDLAGQADDPATSDAYPSRLRLVPGNGDGTFLTPYDQEYFAGLSRGSAFQLRLVQSVAADVFRDGRPSWITVGDWSTGSGATAEISVLRSRSG
ncbi:MAG: hypothetical protein QOH43_4533 [Solirubrobacteraceae bacterium]|nr:hypothetical protein [Solirubrobacteraceae bacterium]